MAATIPRTITNVGRAMKNQMNRTVAEKLEHYSIPEPNSGCLLWIGAICTGTGYGHLGIKGRTVDAHRASWQEVNGPIPAGMHVLHTCDTRPCINPNHLFLGTPLTNAKDRQDKGRWRGGDIRGEASGNAKLTETQVLEIRAASGTLKEIAARYGITASAVEKIRYRVSWRHL